MNRCATIVGILAKFHKNHIKVWKCHKILHLSSLMSKKDLILQNGGKEIIKMLRRIWRKTSRPIFHVKHNAIEQDSPLRPEKPGNKIKDIVSPLIIVFQQLLVWPVI